MGLSSFPHLSISATSHEQSSRKPDNESGMQGARRAPSSKRDSGRQWHRTARGRGRMGAGVPARGGALRQLSCLDVCNDHLHSDCFYRKRRKPEREERGHQRKGSRLPSAQHRTPVVSWCTGHPQPLERARGFSLGAGGRGRRVLRGKAARMRGTAGWTGGQGRAVDGGGGGRGKGGRGRAGAGAPDDS